jgi:transcriptional regulator with XRE-family HTH domain
MKITWQQFGAWLQQVRKRRGLSQENLAELMRYHRIQIWRLEHGRSRPSIQFLQLLQYKVALTPDELHWRATFEQMAAYHCEVIEQASVPARGSIQ